MQLLVLLAAFFAPLPAPASLFSLPQNVDQCSAVDQQFSCENPERMRAEIDSYCDHKQGSKKPPPSLSPDDARKFLERQRAECVEARLTPGNASCARCRDLRAAAGQPAPGTQPVPGTGPRPDTPPPSKDKPDQPDPSAQRPDRDDCNSRDCLQRAAQEQREAEALARQRKLEMDRALRETQRNKNSTITTAADFLDQWGQAIARNPKATPQEQAQYQSDRRLFERAISGQPFTAQEAQAAQSPFVRDALERYGESGAQEVEYQRESEKSAKSEAAMKQLAQRTETRAGNLGQVQGSRAPATYYPQNNGAPAAPAGKRPAAPGAQSTIAVVARDSLPGDGRPGGVDAPGARAGGKSPGGDSGVAAGAGAQQSAGGRAGPGLRELLKRRLGEKGGRGGRAGEAGVLAGRDLERRGSGLWAEGEPAVSGFAAEVLAEAERKPPDFTIGAEETSRQLQQMITEAGIGEGQGGSGLLGMDSATLFERVRHAHRSCQARDCVRQQAP